MSNASDDLTALFTAAPAGPSQPMAYRQGVITAWNPVTLENTVSVGGATLTNVPVFGLAEADSYTVDSVVGLMVVGSTWAIMGLFVIPNTAGATAALKRLNNRIFTDSITTVETCSSTTYVNLATTGPAVTVPVGASGRILIIGSAQMQWSTAAGGTSQNQGRITVALTGANTVGPDDTSPFLGMHNLGYTVSAGTIDQLIVTTITGQAVYSGLNTGDTTVTMKYRNAHAATNSSDFARRVLTVIKL